jgi:hypothetical protein
MSQNILDEGYVLEKQFADDHGVSQHTVARYRLDGLPWLLWGGKVFVHLPGAREYLTKRLRRRAPPQTAKGGGADA